MTSHQNTQLDGPHPSDVQHTTTPVNDIEASSPTEKIERVVSVNAEADDDTAKEPEDLRPDASAQAGVQKVQAITLSWTKASLAVLLCL